MSLPRLDSGSLPRERLLDVLNFSAALSLIRAPTGWGKSVLALQWAHVARARGVAVHWLDATYSAGPEVMESLRNILVKDVPVLPISDVEASRGLRESWHAARSLDTELVIVIDNFEKVAAEVGKDIVDLARAGDKLRFVLCLKGAGDFVRNANLEVDVRTVYSEDLLFTSAECKEVAAQHGIDLNSYDVERAMATTSGWPAMVRVGLVDGRGTGKARVEGSWSEDKVTRFLRGRLLPTLDADTRTLLVRMSFIEYLTVDTVASLDVADADEAMEDLEQLGILDPRPQGGGLAFGMPQALSDVLRSEYDESIHGSLAELHVRVADSLVELGLPGAALAQVYVGRCWPKAVEVVGRHPWELLTSHGRLLARVLRDAPPLGFAAVPTAELVRLVMDRAEGAPLSLPQPDLWSDDALADVVARGDAVEVLDQLSLLSIVVRRRGDVRRVTDFARAGRRLAAISPGEDVHLAAVRLSINVGVAELWDGQIVESLDRFESAYNDCPQAQSALRCESAVYAALARAILGEVRVSLDWLRRAEAIGHGGSVALLDIGLAVAVAEAFASVDSGGGEGEPTAMSISSSRVVQSELWPIALWARVRLALLGGGRRELLGLLEMERLTNSEHIVPGTLSEAVVDVSQADLLMSLGRGSEAHRILDPHGSDHMVVLVAKARLAQLEGRGAEALALASSAIQGSRTAHRMRCEAMIVAAAALDSDERPEECRLMLEAAAQAAARHDLQNSFAAVSRELLGAYADQVPELAPIIQELDRRRVRQLFPSRIESVKLTPRESEVLKSFSRGYTTDQVARELFVSKNTVKSQTISLYRKLNASSRAEALTRAHELGLLN